MLEEYGADLRYIMGKDNVAAEEISRLPISKDKTEGKQAMLNRRMYVEEDTCSVSTEFIKKAQDRDNDLSKWIKQGHPTKTFEQKDLGNTELWAYKAKRGNDELLVYIPLKIREELAQW